ncbi:MAG: hypothetical protein K8T10_05700 [Candidatus Eremiobacteraeota bacterium]|nr:hypothetical protein [Candidatus Eremiobacteraeota bacterium]
MAVYQGIDSGSSKIRKITVKSGLGGFSAISKGKPGKKILALPSNLVTFRRFSFPFRDKRRIMDVLPGELMETLVLPLEKMVWDVSSIHRENASILVAVREEMEQFVKSGENSISVIDTEPSALARVAAYNNIKNALIIDLGASKTTFCGVRDGRLDLVRVRIMGGNKIDNILSHERKITQEEVGEIKQTEGLHDKEIRRFFDDLFKSASIHTPFDYEQIVLTGGGGQMPGLAKYVEEYFEAPVTYFELPSGLSPFFDSVAFGAALYDSVGQEKVNFKKVRDDGKNVSFHWVFLLLIPLLIYSISLVMEESQLKKQNKQIVNAMKMAVKEEFPKKKRVRYPLPEARAIIKKEEKGQTGSSRKVIPMLHDISSAGKKLDVSFYEMDMTEDNIRLKGEAESFQGVDEFRSALEKYFDKAETLVQKRKGDDSVDFTIKVTPESRKEPKKGRRKSS